MARKPKTRKTRAQHKPAKGFAMRADVNRANLMLRGVCRVGIQYSDGSTKMLFVEYRKMKPIINPKMAQQVYRDFSDHPWLFSAATTAILDQDHAEEQRLETLHLKAEEEYKLHTLLEQLDSESGNFIRSIDCKNLQAIGSVLTQNKSLDDEIQLFTDQQLDQLYTLCHDHGWSMLQWQLSNSIQKTLPIIAHPKAKPDLLYETLFIAFRALLEEESKAKCFAKRQQIYELMQQGQTLDQVCLQIKLSRSYTRRLLKEYSDLLDEAQRRTAAVLTKATDLWMYEKAKAIVQKLKKAA